MTRSACKNTYPCMTQHCKKPDIIQLLTREVSLRANKMFRLFATWDALSKMLPAQYQSKWRVAATNLPYNQKVKMVTFSKALEEGTINYILNTNCCCKQFTVPFNDKQFNKQIKFASLDYNTLLRRDIHDKRILLFNSLKAKIFK